MASKRDYYDVLGVGRNASADEIRKAHRKLVRQYHPDANRDNPQAAERFREVQEAYDVISDTEKRKQYDEFGHAAFDPRSQPPPGGRGPSADPFESFRRGGQGRNYRSWKASPNVTVEDFDVESGGFADIFEQFFGRSAGKRKGEPRQQQRGSDIEHSATISFEQAARGCTMPLQLNREGQIETIDLKIPSGVKDGSRVRLRGKGQPGINGQNGDLYITTRVVEHPYFHRQDLDVYVDLPVSLYEAMLGAKVDVPTLDGKVTLTIPPGTSSGAKLRIKSRGIRRGGEQGDQFVVVKVVVPKHVDDHDRRTLEQLAAKYPVNARQDVRWQQ
jgi:DnaJ-class molecular chaperone